MVAELTIRVSVFTAQSLDGYIARPDGNIDWLDAMEPIPYEGDAGYKAFFDSVDVLVMGRGTFEKVLEFDTFPYQDKPVMVLSRSLTALPDTLPQTVYLENLEPQPLLEKLASQEYKRVYLDGGQLIQSFLREGLVDDMIVTTLPILIGEGLPLFGKMSEDVRLEHISTQSWTNGFVQSTYRVQK